MASQKKRKLAPPPESCSSSSGSEAKSSDLSNSDSDEAERSSDSENGSDINVDLEFFDPQEADFQGLKSLLHLLLDGKEYGSSELVDTIIKQARVGSVIRTGEDGDPLGLITVLNTRRYAELQCMRQILGFLIQNAPTSEDGAKLQQVWEADGTGLMLTERLANTPPQLAPPLIQSVFEEIHWALEDEPTQAGAEGLLQVQRLPGAKKVVFARPEDEYFHKHAEWSFTFPVANRAIEKDELRQLRMVMCLKPAKLRAARRELDEVVGNPVADLAAA
ncbi:hypothetical protein WJX84_011170 [Apatococcus fuscideae]|uniref:Protein BCCIP homolog n=1 Tax=Apatococcus fuscideae TaxID=2026836 RepID=A0AAW1TC81_9CHLO